MTVEQYLKQAYKLNEKIKDKQERLINLKELSTSIGAIDYAKDRVQTSPEGEAPFTKLVVMILELEKEIEKYVQSIRIRSAWRVEGTLREYPKFEPVNMWFKYPIHTVDTTGILNDLEAEGNTPAWQKAINKRKDPDKKKQERKEALEILNISK